MFIFQAQKRQKGSWYMVRRQLLLLLYEVKLQATAQSLLCAFAPVIHTRTPFDFRECSAGASVCNAAVNSLWLNHKLRALRECCQFSTGEGLIHSVSDAINQIKHPSALLEEFLRSADSRGVPERARDEPIRQTVAVRLATVRQRLHMSSFEKLARAFCQI